ncbi:MAG: NPCBM/NEW2 domain-containing protein [Candidatus Symbiothrix sp.]|jgi:hypothetical protein|nr:NPCBM/NEW2 domain-containing protein [Candidatus Symbiothrix sp.]
MKPIALFLLILATSTVRAQSDFHTWAETPPMGWNSWDCFGPTVVESEVKANADYMAEHLKPFGWQYIVVDIRWFVENDKAGGYNQTNPIYVMDEYGRYTPALNRFPSAANGMGFKPLADYVHDKGLKFGIHIMRGVPKKAVTEKLPVKDADGITADKIYTTADQCTWLKDNYTIVADSAGAQEYYNSIMDLYASWGVDFIKIDDLSRPYHQAEIEMIRQAIDRTGRPIVLSMSPGETPVEKAAHARNHANMWRTVDDFWDNWDQLLYQFTVCNKWYPYSGGGAWADADMLPLGHISIRGERGSPRMTNFTRDEQFTLMSLWSIFKSPLMFGGHLPDNDSFTDSLITNPEIIYVNQHSRNNRQIFNDGENVMWAADDATGDDKFVALFNIKGGLFVEVKKAIYRSGLISNLTDGYGVNIQTALPAETRDLFLVVSDAGDGYSADHADWIDPILYNQTGDTLHLTTSTWESATTGWGTIQKNKSIGGGNLTIHGKVYPVGIGTHANSIIHYAVPAGYTHFAAFAGLDNSGISQNIGSTVEFMLFTEDPSTREVNTQTAIANSGRVSRTMRKEGVQIEANIAGASKLYLVVTDAGDGFDYDHADWINPTLHKADGTTLDLTTLNWVKATSGWDSVKRNKSLDNNSLKVNGTTYTKGFGTNSYSVIEFDLPTGYTKFTAFCGFDDEVKSATSGVSIEFLVYTSDPYAFPPEQITLDFAALNLQGKYRIRDLWTHSDLGEYSTANQFAPTIPQHGAGLYRLSPVQSESIPWTSNKATPIYLTKAGNDYVLRGVTTGSEVSVFDATGKLLTKQHAQSEKVPVYHHGALIINIKNNGDSTAIKTVIP